MQQRVVQCACGQEMRVPPEALHRTGRCVGCGAALRVEGSNSRLVEKSPQGESLVSSDAAATTAQCARCKLPFRGDWDRNQTDEGLLCLRCARRWRPEAEARQAAPIEQRPPAPIMAREFYRPFQEVEKPVKPPPSKREVLVFAGLAVGLLLFILLLPVEDWLNRLLLIEQDVELSQSQTYVLMAFSFISGTMGFFFWLYVGLSWSHKLPHDEMRLNVIELGIVAMAFQASTYLELNFAFAIALTLLRFIIVSEIWDLDVRDFVFFFFAYLLMSFLMSQMNAVVAAIILGSMA